MKKTLIFVLILIVLALVALDTNPDSWKHKEKIKSHATQLLTSNASDPFSALLGAGLSTAVVGVALETIFNYQSYGVCSVGSFVIGDETYPVSIGIFGIVVPLFGESTLEKLNE